MDKNGYPEEAELKTIRKWDVLKSNVYGLLKFIENRWRWADHYMKSDGDIGVSGTTIELHTGGWAGNESIVGALQDNTMFWTMCWIKSERGGHYWFEIPLSLRSINPATQEQP